MASNWRSGISFASMRPREYRAMPLADVRLSFELARRGYRRYAAYPGAMVAGLFTNVFFGFLIAYILLAVYDETVSIGGYDVEDAIAYVWISQGLLSVAGIFGPGWFELARRVQTGDVATDLQRPVDVQRAGFAADVGRAAYQLVWRAVPQFLLGALLFAITVPEDAARWIAVRPQPRACRRRQLRDPLPRQPLLVLAARLPRAGVDRDRRQPRALGRGHPAHLLPGAAGHHPAADAVRRGAPDAGRHLRRPAGRRQRRPSRLRCNSSGRSRSTAPASSRSPPARESWCCRVVELGRGSTCGSSVRACVHSSSTGSPPYFSSSAPHC